MVRIFQQREVQVKNFRGERGCGGYSGKVSGLGKGQSRDVSELVEFAL